MRAGRRANVAEHPLPNDEMLAVVMHVVVRRVHGWREQEAPFSLSLACRQGLVRHANKTAEVDVVQGAFAFFFGVQARQLPKLVSRLPTRHPRLR